MFDVLIIGGGVSGVSAALLFGSAKEKSFMIEKKLELLRIKKVLRCKMLFSIMHTALHRVN